MGRQPYIPLYVGDYLKDTRILPLSVRGFWVDMILFMWDAPVRGEITGHPEDFARLAGCTTDEANFALNLLKQKSTADFVLLADGQTKIISRKMKRDAEISKKRSEAGKNGVDAKFAKAKAEAIEQAKLKQKPEYDNEVEIDIELKLTESLDEIYIDGQRPKWGHIDFDFEYNSFCEKVRGSPGHYANHDTGAMRLAFQSQLRHAKKKTNGTPKDKRSQHLEDLATDFAKRASESP